jgi:protein-tyrosine-phosphatase
MAEAFARNYGADVLDAYSAGIRPSARISRRTCAVMEEKGIFLNSLYSTKHISSFDLDDFEMIVNLCEYGLPKTSARVVKRSLRDPCRGDDDAFRDVRDDVEQLVRFVVEHFRAARRWHADPNPLYSEECAKAAEARS